MDRNGIIFFLFYSLSSLTCFSLSLPFFSLSLSAPHLFACHSASPCLSFLPLSLSLSSLPLPNWKHLVQTLGAQEESKRKSILGNWIWCPKSPNLGSFLARCLECVQPCGKNNSPMIECLKNLESIYLWTCDSIEVIFELEQLNVEENHMALVLDQLRNWIYVS